MELTAGEQIRVILKRRGLSVADLAERLEVSRQNLNQQMIRDNFREQDIKRIAAALDCDCKIEITEHE